MKRKLMSLLAVTIFALLCIFIKEVIEECMLQVQLEQEHDAKAAAQTRGSKVLGGPGVIIIYEVKRR